MAHLQTVPHLQVPFRIMGESALTVDQDSLTEIAQNVRVIVGTRQGERLVVPDFGISDPTFQLEIDLVDIEEAVALYEPRARLTMTQTGEEERDVEIRVGRG